MRNEPGRGVDGLPVRLGSATRRQAAFGGAVAVAYAVVVPRYNVSVDGIKSLVTWGRSHCPFLPLKLKGRLLHWLGLAAAAL